MMFLYTIIKVRTWLWMGGVDFFFLSKPDNWSAGNVLNRTTLSTQMYTDNNYIHYNCWNATFAMNYQSEYSCRKCGFTYKASSVSLFVLFNQINCFG